MERPKRIYEFFASRLLTLGNPFVVPGLTAHWGAAEIFVDIDLSDKLKKTMPSGAIGVSEFSVADPIRRFSPPFQSCYFEGRPGENLFSMTYSGDSGESTVGVGAMLLAELHPHEFALYVLFHFDGKQYAGYYQIMVIDDQMVVDAFPDEGPASIGLGKMFVAFLDRVLLQMAEYEMGSERIARNVGLNREFRRGKHVARVIHLRPRGTAPRSYEPGAFHYRIEWDASFLVRGHWRRLGTPEKLGKDRAGERAIRGFTWVTEHTRGDGELIHRIHVAPPV